MPTSSGDIERMKLMGMCNLLTQLCIEQLLDKCKECKGISPCFSDRLQPNF